MPPSLSRWLRRTSKTEVRLGDDAIQGHGKREDRGSLPDEKEALTKRSKSSGTVRRAYSSRTATQTSLPSPVPEVKQSPTISLCNHSSDSRAQISHSLLECSPPISSVEVFHLNSGQVLPASSDRQKLQNIFQMPKRSTISTGLSKPAKIGPDCTFDLFEALSMGCTKDDNGNKISTPDDTQGMPVDTKAAWSDTVKRLMKEADEAFKAVEFALTDAESTSEEGYNIALATVGPSLQSRTLLRKQHKAPVARMASVSRLRRRKPPKQTSRPTKPPKSPRPTPVPSPRWTLTEVTDGVAEILTGKILSRGKADENITLGKLRPLQIDSQAQVEVKNFSEIIQSSSKDEEITPIELVHLTPIEPIHLPDLPSRIEEAGFKRRSSHVLNGTSATLPKPQHRLIKQLSDDAAGERLDDNNTSDLQFHNFNFPSPPRTPVPQGSLSSISTYSLPSTPEVSPFLPRRLPQKFLSSPLLPVTPENFSCSSDALLKHRRKAFEPLEVLTGNNVLKSTPYSLMSIGFRHGSIRLNRHSIRPTGQKERPKNMILKSVNGSGERKEWKCPAEMDGDDKHHKSWAEDRDGAFDWNVFQMAISEGTGDHMTSDCDSLVASFQEQNSAPEIDVIDDIADWWAGLRIELGSLETEDPRSIKKRTLKAKLKTEAATNGLKLPPTLQSGTNSQIQTTGIKEDSFTSEFTRLKSEISNLRALQDIGNRPPNTQEDGMSLPPSPMEELSPSELLRSLVVPMGFNLGHDLGDFLKWENECVAEEI